MGKKPRHMRPSLAEFTAKVVGTPYGLGSADCVTLLLRAAEARGAVVPEAFEGITKESYPALYRENRPEAEGALLRFVETLGERIPAERAFAWDILVIRPRPEGAVGVGIHAGHSQVLAAFEERGINLADLRAYEILTAFRWRYG